MRGARRAYWITEKPELLDYYIKGFSTVPSYMLTLKSYVADNPDQVKNVEVLDSLVSAALRLWKQNEVGL